MWNRRYSFLAARVEQKLASRRAGEVLNRLHVAQPKPRDAVSRPAVIPHSVALNRMKKADGSLKIVTEKEMQDANGGAGWALFSALVVPDRKKRISAEEALNHAFFDAA